MSDGRCTFWITCAMVKVLPEPVTPSSTWSRSRRTSPSVRSRIACGWSPAGRKSETIWNGLPGSGADNWIARSSTTGSEYCGLLDKGSLDIRATLVRTKEKRQHRNAGVRLRLSVVGNGVGSVVVQGGRQHRAGESLQGILGLFRLDIIRRDRRARRRHLGLMRR